MLIGCYKLFVGFEYKKDSVLVVSKEEHEKSGKGQQERAGTLTKDHGHGEHK